MVHHRYLLDQLSPLVMGIEALTNHVWAVILVVGFALRALHARLYLRTNTNPISSLELLDL